MKTLAQALLEIARLSPDRLAIRMLERDHELSLSYHDLLSGAVRFYEAFERLRVERARPLVILLPHGREIVDAFLGAVFYGAVPSILPYLTEKMSPERYRESLQALMRVTDPAALLTYAAFRKEAEKAKRGAASSAPLLVVEEIGEGSGDAFFRSRMVPESPDDLVLLQHSSGTTGLQKGVALTHRALHNQVEHYAEAVQMTDQDVVVSWLPLYHDMGLITGFLMPLMLGAKLVLMSPFDWVRAPQRLLQAVSKERGTLSWLPNFAFNFCAQKIRETDLNGLDLSSWRGVINCSEPVALDSQRQFLRRFRSRGLRSEVLGTSYALAENVFAVTQSRLGEQVPFEMVDRHLFERDHVAKPVSHQKGLAILSSGRPIQGTDVQIVDDAGEKLPDRFLGEIIIQSDCLFRGYYQREDLNAQAFREGWFLSGDLGYLAEGNLYVTGREKDLIIVGGRNIYPQDLEAIASSVEGVHPGRVCAFGVYREELGTEAVVMVAESELEGQAARRELKEKVRLEVNRGSDVVLSRLQIVDPGWLFKTSSGKIARAANRSQYLDLFEKDG